MKLVASCQVMTRIKKITLQLSILNTIFLLLYFLKYKQGRYSDIVEHIGYKEYSLEIDIQLGYHQSRNKE
jgi:hypothetical protein